jgi:transcriptional regulator with XRE-family HTH domain
MQTAETVMKGTPLPLLVEWRRARGWSQQDLARRAGVTQATICLLETDGARGARHETIAKIAKALRIRQEELLHMPPAEAFRIRIQLRLSELDASSDAPS